MVLGFATAGDKKEEEIVDAIEHGRIVKVKESYARQEGLMILRKTLSEDEKTKQSPGAKFGSARKRVDEEYTRNVYGDDLRKPLRWLQNKVVQDLVPNFQWVINQARRTKNISRKQLANAIGEPESSVKMIENGVLPKDDFVLINKLQTYLGVNLRKDKTDYYNNVLKKAMDSKAPNVQTQPAGNAQKPAEKLQDSGEKYSDDVDIF